jgi:hypothetical protein
MHSWISAALFVGLAQPLIAQPVTRCPSPDQTLPQRWDWALKEAGKLPNGTSLWIGYSVLKPMRRNAFIGAIYSDARRNSPSLCEALGLDFCIKEAAPFRGMHNFTMTEGMTYIGDEDGGSEIVQKEIGILFEMPSDKHTKMTSAVISNFSLHVDLHKEPVLWLGEAKEEESIAFLIARYNKGENDRVQKKIISIAGMQGPSDRTVTFLSDILEDGKQLSHRKEAAFWLGQTNSTEALRVLLKTAEDETSGELREESIFAISQMDDSIGTEPLIKLAKTGKNRNVRSKAMFWLGQKASRKADETLKEIIEEDDDTEIQKQALFALSQSESGGGVDELIRIAKTHHSAEVRKQAIYLLGESEDERALDVLVEIVRGR